MLVFTKCKLVEAGLVKNLEVVSCLDCTSLGHEKSNEITVRTAKLLNGVNTRHNFVHPEQRQRLLMSKSYLNKGLLQGIFGFWVLDLALSDLKN